ncbi:hypothetical protein LOK74_17105 [Brevibacillus humidisoli]|uniref:matrixin family metalloprotease n=1 Tax=Brevibacillus humidisoli TaxID=2895522 RepID=UPI001E425ED6|nr:matrixin family metalloprotease [Brevibacillus humidisoli]UFJ39758.1 hypothetical protein LOK74_17105 [Brevibacillus humidisoli]
MIKKTGKVMVVSLLTTFLFSSVAFAADLGTLNYWYSDKDIINRWGYKSMSIWSGSIDGFSTSKFASYVSHAISQWNSAGFSLSGEDDETDSVIRIYGGTYNTLKEMEPSLKTSNTGLTSYDGGTKYEGEWIYSGSEKSSYKISSPVNVYIVYKSGRSDSGFKKTSTHELGHALGWRGHSSRSSDVMYGSASEVTQLTSRDKNHLLQVY